MKKEKNYLGMLIKEFAVYAVEIILAAGAIIGAFYVVNLLADCLGSFVTIEMGLLVLFTMAGLALYIDFRPDKEDSREKRSSTQMHVVSKASSRKMLRAYSAK